MDLKMLGIVRVIVVILIVGILSTGQSLDPPSPITYSIRLWDAANLTEISKHRTKNGVNGSSTSSSSASYSANKSNPSSSSSVIRARMEVSASSSSSVTIPAPQNTPTHNKRSLNLSPPTTNGGKDSKIPPLARNKPLLNSLVSKLDMLASKMDQLSQTQIQIQKSFDNLESRYSLSSTTDDVPQCGRRVDRVLRTLTPLVSRVEGLWNVVLNGSTPKTTAVFSPLINSSSSAGSQSKFLGPPPNDILLSESRRQERAIAGIRNDLSLKASQIMTELGTVEQQLDVLQTNFKKPGALPSQTGAPPVTEGIEQPEQLSPELPSPNDVTLLAVDTFPPQVNGSRHPGLVFPSVKNKPSLEATGMEGFDAFLTGSGQTVTSCAELFGQGAKRSGLYHLRLPGSRSSFWQLLAYCDQETAGGGWMVIQRRADFGEPRESFHRNWVEYRSGFGDPVKEMWMGNINLHLLTTSEDQILRIELEDFDGERRYAEYSTFKVASEADGFRLEVSGYSGDAGDALSDPWYGAHGSAFSTHDRDNDRSSLNCASMLKGGWWWKSCGRGLNGIYFDASQPDSALARQGIVWFRWKGWDYTLRRAIMMIRPKAFRPETLSSNNSTVPV